MSATTTTPTVSVPVPRRGEVRPGVPVSSRRSAQAEAQPRSQRLEQGQKLEAEARLAAEQGDVAGSARLILESLACERRAGGIGPQVLQLIKPRG